MYLFLGNSNKCPFVVYATGLSTELKDYKSAEAIALSRESYKNVIREESSQQGFDINNVEVREDEGYSLKTAHLVITNIIDAKTKSELLTELEQIKLTRLDLKVINLINRFPLKTVLHIILLSCQWFTLQDETVHGLALPRTLSFCICVCYEILSRLSCFFSSWEYFLGGVPF